MAESKGKRRQVERDEGQGGAKRRYRSRGVDVEIAETAQKIELRLDGHPIDVELIDGEYHSQTANMFTSFGSVEEIVDTLLANEGRTWTLHGHVCDERCGAQGHHDGQDHGGHDHGGHDHGGHDHGGHDHGPGHEH